MPRAAKLKVSTEFDGKAVDQGLANTERRIGGFERVLGGKLAGAMLSIFSVEKILQFGKAIDATATKIGDMVKKLEAGKDVAETMSELGKTGASKEQQGFAAAYTELKSKWMQSFDKVKLAILRVSMGATPIPMLFSKEYRDAVLKPQAGRIDRAVAAGNTESDRQSTIKWIEQNSLNTWEEKRGKEERAFKVRELEASLPVQRNMLKELQEMNRKLNPTAVRLLNRTTMFPE